MKIQLLICATVLQVANTKNTEKCSRLWYYNIECWREYCGEVARMIFSDPHEYLGAEE